MLPRDPVQWFLFGCLLAVVSFTGLISLVLTVRLVVGGLAKWWGQRDEQRDARWANVLKSALRVDKAGPQNRDRCPDQVDAPPRS
jgi:hypothetical protein